MIKGMRHLFIGLGVMLVVVVIIFIWQRGRYQKMPQGQMFMAEVVRLKTKDGVEVAGDYYPASGKEGVLLVHMMPVDRKSWVLFAEKLQEAGFRTLAIDLRGHGESDGGPSGYKNFSDEEHQTSRLDLERAAEFLKSKGAARLSLAGASIGANLALEYLVKHREARSVILLSPGLDYRGIKTEPLVAGMTAEQGVFLAASDDDQYSRDSVSALLRHFDQDEAHRVQIFERGGHGTNIFKAHPEFMDELVAWLKGHI